MRFYAILHSYFSDTFLKYGSRKKIQKNWRFAKKKDTKSLIPNNQPIFDWNKFQNFFLYLLIQANAFLHRAKPSILIFRNFSDQVRPKVGDCQTH